MLTDAEKEALVELHRRLVVSIAKKYQVPTGRFVAIVDAGYEGLLKAVEAYEPGPEPSQPSDRTYTNMMDGTTVHADERFEAHASPLIRAEIERALGLAGR